MSSSSSSSSSIVCKKRKTVASTATAAAVTSKRSKTESVTEVYPTDFIGPKFEKPRSKLNKNDFKEHVLPPFPVFTAEQRVHVLNWFHRHLSDATSRYNVLTADHVRWQLGKMTPAEVNTFLFRHDGVPDALIEAEDEAYQRQQRFVCEDSVFTGLYSLLRHCVGVYNDTDGDDDEPRVESHKTVEPAQPFSYNYHVLPARMTSVRYESKKEESEAVGLFFGAVLAVIRYVRHHLDEIYSTRCLRLERLDGHQWMFDDIESLDVMHWWFQVQKRLIDDGASAAACLIGQLYFKQNEKEEADEREAAKESAAYRKVLFQSGF